MIVDVHQHFIAMRPDIDEKVAAAWVGRVAEGFHESHGGGARSERVDVSVEQIRERLGACVPDPDARKLIARMDRAGIDVTVTCVVDNIENGADDARMMSTNRLCAQAAKQSGGRLIALAGIDPRRKEAPQLLRQCVEEYGMRGLKWHPDDGYYPNSPEAYAVLKVAEELGVPLLTHTGPLHDGSIPRAPGVGLARAKFAHPRVLDEVAQDFPKLKIIAAHMGGRAAWLEWSGMAQNRPNLYGDMAMWQQTAVANYERFCRELRDILDLAGTDAVLFGTDDPFHSAIVPTDRYVQLMRDLPEKAPAGIKFTKAEIDAILGGNAQNVFGL